MTQDTLDPAIILSYVNYVNLDYRGSTSHVVHYIISQVLQGFFFKRTV